MLETKFKLLLDAIGKYSQYQYPLEACGIITLDFEFIPSNNLSNNPRHSFIIDPIIVNKYDGNIWGIFHSHTDEKFETPSELDMSLTVYPDIKFILFNNKNYYIYWYDTDKNIKRYEKFNEDHCKY